MTYNSDYYVNGKLRMKRGHIEAIHTYETKDGTLIGMFQGSRGTHPELDFRVRYLNAGAEARPVMLPHVDWIVDVLLKAQTFHDDMVNFLDYYISFYDKCEPFKSVEERANYKPVSLEHIRKTYPNIVVPGTLSIDGLALILELFCLCEKQNEGAHQFKYSLQWTKECIEGKRNYRVLLNLAINHREY